MIPPNLHVLPGHLVGYATDIDDFANQFSARASKYVRSIELPSGTTGLMTQLAGPLESFQARTAEAHRRELDHLSRLSDHVSGTGRAFHTADGAAAHLDVTRFGGTEFPDEPDAQAIHTSTPRVVEWAVNILSPFEAQLRETGIQPVEHRLTPVACNWGELQPLAHRIHFLGVNDRALTTNLESGSRWLAGYWSGASSEAFERTSAKFGERSNDRSNHMIQVARTIYQGGQHIERLVRNQARLLVDDLMRPTSHLGFSLPLALYGTILSRPMPADMHSSIQADLHFAMNAAQARHERITSVLQSIKTTLTATPGSVLPSFDDPPPEFHAGDCMHSYGFESNRQWKVSLEAPTVS